MKKISRILFGIYTALAFNALADDLSDAKKQYDAHQYERALPLFISAASQGQSDAYGYLGFMYSYGQGVTKDHKQAAIWHEKAAEAGNAFSQEQLASMYKSGIGVERDINKAVFWYEKAAGQGLSNSQQKLAEMYYSGNGVQQNFSTAIMWYEKAALLGNNAAAQKLGMIYYTGRDVPQDYIEAYKWLSLALKGNNSVNQTLIEIETKISPAQLVDAKNKTAVFLEKTKADKVARDEEGRRKELAASEKAAADGNPDEQVRIGRLYKEGKVYPQDINKARELFEKAAAQNNANAQYELGLMYMMGNGVTKNMQQAIALYEKAGLQGSADAVTQLMTIYSGNYKEVPMDIQKVKFWDSKLTEVINDNLGRTQRNKTETINTRVAHVQASQPVSSLQGEALRFEFEANNGNAEAQTSLGVMFLYGNNVEQDYIQAYKWLSLAAQAGNRMAAVNLKKAENKMTPEQITTAQNLVSSWKSRSEAGRVK